MRRVGRPQRHVGRVGRRGGGDVHHHHLFFCQKRLVMHLSAAWLTITTTKLLSSRCCHIVHQNKYETLDYSRNNILRNTTIYLKHSWWKINYDNDCSITIKVNLDTVLECKQKKIWHQCELCFFFFVHLPQLIDVRCHLQQEMLGELEGDRRGGRSRLPRCIKTQLFKATTRTQPTAKWVCTHVGARARLAYL